VNIPAVEAPKPPKPSSPNIRLDSKETVPLNDTIPKSISILFFFNLL
jgi:hypothetical protein